MFERFIPQGRGGPKLMIWDRGQVCLNKAAVQQFSADQYTHAVFFFDRKNGLVGVKLIKDGNESGAHRMCFRSGDIRISAMSFVRYLAEYDLQTKSPYPLKWDAKQGLLVADLKQGQGKRKGKTRTPGRRE